LRLYDHDDVVVFMDDLRGVWIHMRIVQ